MRDHTGTRRAAARGFTLVELLVVIGIITILVGILMPTLAKVRQAGNRTACRANLHDIGSRLQMYLTESKGRLPYVNTMPSVQPPINNYPALVYVLAPYTHGPDAAYRCRDDRITQPSPGSPDGYETYFDREGSSYQYSSMLASMYGGDSVTDKRIYARRGDPSKTVFVGEYEAFHDLIGANDAMNALFLDMHVADVTDGF